MATVALAASVALFVCGVGSKPESLPSGWQARGSSKSASLTRDVGVRIFKLVPEPCPLKEAEVLDPNTAFTVGVRNLGRNVGHALVFAIDAHDEVHWIAPAFTQPETDPVSITIERLPNEQLLPTSVVFDDMAMGPLRVLSIVGSNSMHVSEIERLVLNDLALEELKRRFSSADVRELNVSVKATGNR